MADMQDLSGATILKNIFEFAKILNSASQNDVSLWNDQSLENALGWADFCQEMSVMIKGQEYEENVNKQLRQMTVFLDPVSCHVLSVDSLCCARNLLLETLVSNPKFLSSSQAKLCQILSETCDGKKILQEITQKIFQSTKRLESLKDLVCSATDSDEMRFVDCSKSTFEAKVLMQSMVSALQYVPKLDRFEKYCSDVFNKLSATKDGWNILVKTLTMDNDDLPHDGTIVRDKIIKHFLTCLKEKVSRDGCASHIWSVSKEVLVQTSSVCEQFFLIYLEALLAMGDSCSPQIHVDGFIHWRSESGHNLTELCFHFQSLLGSSSSLSKDRKVLILQAVTARVKGTDFTVWRGLVQTLLRVMKTG